MKKQKSMLAKLEKQQRRTKEISFQMLDDYLCQPTSTESLSDTIKRVINPLNEPKMKTSDNLTSVIRITANKTHVIALQNNGSIWTKRLDDPVMQAKVQAKWICINDGTI